MNYRKTKTITLKDDVTAKITVSFQPTEVNWEITQGYDLCNVALLKGGKPLGRQYETTQRTFKSITAGKLATSQKLSYSADTEIIVIGQALITGDVTRMIKNLNETIEELYAEIEIEAGEKTVSTKEIDKEEKETYDRYAHTVEKAEEQGVDGLMTDAEKTDYLNAYHKVQNEGGQGFLPNIISKEQYEHAKQYVTAHKKPMEEGI